MLKKIGDRKPPNALMRKDLAFAVLVADFFMLDALKANLVKVMLAISMIGIIMTPRAGP